MGTHCLRWNQWKSMKWHQLIEWSGPFHHKATNFLERYLLRNSELGSSLRGGMTIMHSCLHYMLVWLEQHVFRTLCSHRWLCRPSFGLKKLIKEMIGKHFVKLLSYVGTKLQSCTTILILTSHFHLMHSNNSTHIYENESDFHTKMFSRFSEVATKN